MRPHLLTALLLLITPLALSQSQPAPTVDSLTADYTHAFQAKDYAGAITIANQLVHLSPTSQNLFKLGSAQLYSGASEISLTTFNMALAIASTEKPTPTQSLADFNDAFSKIYIAKGNALLKLKRNDEAIDAYTHSAELAANQGLAWFNVCATLYNIGNTTGSVTACRKALAADPKNANAWFVLASNLFADTKVDASGKFTITDETRSALNQYLQLAPDGPHAADVKAMLDMTAK
jgi:tetratricopeptide (TPR) repeat protein